MRCFGNLKRVREVIEVRQHVFRPLIKDFGLEKIIEIVIILLNGQVFQSKLKAKIAFPKLFRTTPSRDIQRALILKSRVFIYYL